MGVCSWLSHLPKVRFLVPALSDFISRVAFELVLLLLQGRNAAEKKLRCGGFKTGVARVAPSPIHFCDSARFQRSFGRADCVQAGAEPLGRLCRREKVYDASLKLQSERRGRKLIKSAIAQARG